MRTEIEDSIKTHDETFKLATDVDSQILLTLFKSDCVEVGVRGLL